jgi:hypothetical protein
MHKLYELKEKLMRELEDYSENGKFSKEDVEAIKYITSAIDHICNIVEDSEGEEYSMAMNPNDMGRGRTYGMGGRSYARGRRRDSMGRYSRNSGYSNEFRADLEELIESAPNEHVKNKMRDLMREI